MNVAMMQPAFMPWQGFFELVHRADRFVLLDDFQFSVQSYHQRNRLFVNPGRVDWYSVPVQKAVSFLAPLNRTRVVADARWRKKMWKRIRQNYEKTPYFDAFGPRLERWLLSTTDSLASLNIGFIRIVCEELGFRTELRLSSNCPSEMKRSTRVLELLRCCEADRYFCAHGSFDYMRDDGVFPVDGIEVLFQDFRPRAYPQLGSPGTFVERLSVADALMNVGPQATAGLIAAGTPKWLTWEEMAAGAAPPPP